jgi:hypothetical protein
LSSLLLRCRRHRSRPDQTGQNFIARAEALGER